MEVNANFDTRVALHTATLPWISSPVAGVDRRMLDRIGSELARATSIVRYAPGSRFAPHVHEGGEEFLVLRGVFQDEHGDYPEGSYVRNPPGSHHTPGTSSGCTLFVKLWQFDAQDLTHVNIDTRTQSWQPDAARAGVDFMPLFHREEERVRLERWAPGTRVSMSITDGAELLILDGDCSEGGTRFGLHDWLRLPLGSTLEALSGLAGCIVWMKTGHLAGPLRVPPLG